MERVFVPKLPLFFVLPSPNVSLTQAASTHRLVFVRFCLSFHCQEWPRCNFSLQYQHNGTQIFDDIKEEFQQGNIIWFTTIFSDLTLVNIYGKWKGESLLKSDDWKRLTATADSTTDPHTKQDVKVSQRFDFTGYPSKSLLLKEMQGLPKLHSYTSGFKLFTDARWPKLFEKVIHDGIYLTVRLSKISVKSNIFINLSISNRFSGSKVKNEVKTVHDQKRDMLLLRFT